LFVYEYNCNEYINAGELVKSFNDFSTKHVSHHHKLMHNCYVSGYDLHKKTKSFDKLLNHIENITNEITNTLIKNTPISVEYKILEAWVASYSKYGYQQEHSHFPFGYSAIYYILAENTSNIEFSDLVIKPYTGMLLLFPGILKHKVMPVLSHHSERIVLACNLYPTFNYSYFQGKN